MDATGVIIRPATGKDITLIKNLAYEIWLEAYGKILSSKQMAYMLDLIYSEASLQKQTEQGHHFLIVEEDTKPVAFADYNNLKDTVYKLQKIYALPSQQGKGIGRLLIDHVIKKVKKAGGTTLLLNVNRHNKAKLFYEHLGFKVISEEDIDIGEGYFMNDNGEKTLLNIKLKVALLHRFI
jgi:ribosomal protein S18 acetylase RimI-like enzyme